MGYGDYIHWTAVVREISKYINDPENNDEKINRIKLLINKNKEFGITKYVQKNKKDLFKFYLTLTWKQNNNKHNLNQNTQANHIFKNNDYITLNEKYPNIIFLKIISNGYWDGIKYISKIPTFVKLFDNIHIVKFYLEKINLPNNYLNNIKTNGYIKFTKSEIKKVSQFLPKEEFILINYQSKVKLRSYDKNKMQNIVNYLKDKIKIIQIIPDKFQNVNFESLGNVTVLKNKFTFRETICFAKNAKYAILSHGGLSLGIACFNVPTICLYSNLFNPKATTFDSEIAYLYSNHNYFCYDNNCSKCLELKNKDNENNIIEIIKNNFNI